MKSKNLKKKNPPAASAEAPGTAYAEEPESRPYRHFGIFLLLFAALACIVVRPLLRGMAWGIVFAFLWHPVHRKISSQSRLARWPNVATTLSLLLLLTCCAIPLILILRAIVGELVSAYQGLGGYVSTIRAGGVPSLTAILPDSLERYVAPFLADREKIAGLLTSLAQHTAALVQDLSKGVLHWTGSFALQGFIAIVTMFFGLRDGRTMLAYVRDLIPLRREERGRFLDHTEEVLKAVAYGVLLTVGIQAVLGGIGWWAAGLPNAYLAAAAMFVCGMFPMGTAVIWLPGGLYLIGTGSVAWGAALLVWGAGVVSSMDNFLRPVFIGGGGAIPTYAIILGLTGGIAAWGLLGVFLGPLAIALFLSVLDLYRARATHTS
jgi:Predicted permease